jgi:hypothetical protein
MALLKVELGSCSETCVTSSQNENQVSYIEVEDCSIGEEGEEEDDDPVLIPFPPVKTEYDVSSVFSDC